MKKSVPVVLGSVRAVLYAVRRSGEHVSLKLRGEIYEVVAEAADADDEVAVIFGMHRGIQKCLTADGRHGELLSAVFKIGAPQREKSVQTVFGKKQCSVKFEVQNEAASGQGMVEAKARSEQCRRAVFVASGCRADAVAVKRLIRPLARGQCADRPTVIRRTDKRAAAAGVYAAALGFQRAQVAVIVVDDVCGDRVDERVVVSEMQL